MISVATISITQIFRIYRRKRQNIGILFLSLLPKTCSVVYEFLLAAFRFALIVQIYLKIVWVLLIINNRNWMFPSNVDNQKPKCRNAFYEDLFCTKFCSIQIGFITKYKNGHFQYRHIYKINIINILTLSILPIMLIKYYALFIIIFSNINVMQSITST